MKRIIELLATDSILKYSIKIVFYNWFTVMVSAILFILTIIFGTIYIFSDTFFNNSVNICGVSAVTIIVSFFALLMTYDFTDSYFESSDFSTFLRYIKKL